MNPIPIHILFQINFNIILPYAQVSQILFSSGVSTIILYALATSSMHYTFPVHLTLLDASISKHLFMSMRRGDVLEQRSPTGLLSTREMICEYGESWWNDTDRGNPKILKRNMSQCHRVHYKSHMD
jgi:hypothetical protein